MASTETTTLFERAQGFVSEHKRAILIGAAAVVAVGGVAYYASTSARPRGEPDLEKAGKKKKSSKGGKKKKTVNDADGPILEEKVPPRVDEECAYQHHFQQRLAHSASYS